MRRFQLLIKRAIDIVVALACFPLVFVAECLAAVVVQTAYPGWPIFIVQERIGKNCQIFGMIKLRTAPVGHAIVNDSMLLPPRRIQLVRRFGIDELSQLLHLLSGKMSLIGNRPLIEEEWYTRYGASAAAIAAMSPGIISRFAIEAHRKSIGDVPHVVYEYNQLAVDLSLAYVTDWSLGQDLRIVRDLIELVARLVWQIIRLRSA